MKDIIISTLAKTMSVNSTDITEKTIIRDIEGFDSLQFVMFISELEEAYKISIPIDSALDAETIEDLINSAENK